jgi:hypothetical protein
MLVSLQRGKIVVLGIVREARIPRVAPKRKLQAGVRDNTMSQHFTAVPSTTPRIAALQDTDIKSHTRFIPRFRFQFA